MPSRISRDEAWTLLGEWIESASLRRHVLAVEAAMRARHALRELELHGRAGSPDGG